MLVVVWSASLGWGLTKLMARGKSKAMSPQTSQFHHAVGTRRGRLQIFLFGQNPPAPRVCMLVVVLFGGIGEVGWSNWDSAKSKSRRELWSEVGGDTGGVTISGNVAVIVEDAQSQSSWRTRQRCWLCCVFSRCGIPSVHLELDEFVVSGGGWILVVNTSMPSRRFFVSMHFC